MKTLVTVSSFLLFSIASFSQHSSFKQAMRIDNDVAELRFDNRSKAPLFIQWKSNAVISTNAMAALQTVLQMQADDRLQLLRMSTDALGIHHLRYQQYYKNIKVVSGIYILHEQQGHIVSANGLFFDHLTLNTVATVPENVALQSALSNVNAKIYKWQIQNEESFKKAVDQNQTATWFPKGELVLLPPVQGSKEHAFTLCWKFDVYAHDPMAKVDVYVNAQTNEVVFKEDRICTIAVPSNGNTKYSGTQSFVADSVSIGNYRLRDVSRSAVVQTYNMQNGNDYGAAVDFTDADNVWTSTVNQDDAALDAHWGAEKTFDYYLNVHNRHSYDDANSPLISYVHYSTEYNNAFWNGSVMTYGDGNGTNFSPLTELDICGHEFSHGVTQYASGLNYSCESGAINEAVSDIFGKSIDFWVNPSTAVWQIASKCFSPATTGDALRYMNNPNAGGQPDTYLGVNWYLGAGDNGGVHINSGVMNYWYYLLVNGGNGTNDNGYGFNVSSIGLEKASKIVYRCNEIYLTPSSQYADAAFYTLKAANDLYGNCSPEAIAVKLAWDAVGVMGLKLNTNAIASSNGSVCMGGTLQLNASGGTSYSWSGPGNFTSAIQNPVINNATASGLYNCVVTDGACADSVPVLVTINSNPVLTASSNKIICKGSSVTLNVSANANAAGGNNATCTPAATIPDYPAMGTYSSIVVSGATYASSIVSVTLDSVTHTWDADLDFKLIAPNGSTITLASGLGANGHHYLHTVFSSSAVIPIADGVAPFNGTFIPQQPFSCLSGTANGTWKLKVTDMAGQDVGTLCKWSIALTPNTIASYNWLPLSGINNATITNPKAAPLSTTVYTVVANDVLGCSASAQTVVTVSNPVITSKSVSDVLCSGANTGAITINVNGGVGNYSYLWSTNSTTKTPSNLTAGVYIVTVTDSINCMLRDTSTITEPLPIAINLTITNATCGSNNGVATANPSGGVAPYVYLWSNGSTVNSTSNLLAGIYTVTVTDANNCSKSNFATIQSVGAIPAAPVSINGPSGACRNQNNVHYTVPVVAGAISYNWVAPTGTTFTTNNNEIILNFGSAYVTKNLAVSVTTACGQSLQTSLSIPYLTAQPGTPGTITGNANACANTTVVYSVSPVLRATSYTWTAPSNASITKGQGTNSVEITFNSSFTSGIVLVSASNCLGTSANRTKNVLSKPNVPASITGAANNLCGAQGIAYSTTASTTGATFYTWSVSSNASIISGQGSTAISASFVNTPVSGSVCVTAGNGCGNSSTKCLSVSLLAARPVSIIGPSSVCVNQANLPFNIVTQPGVTYNWTFPTGSSITNGQGTGAVTATWGAMAGNISVVAHNTCGNQTLRTKAVTINCRMENEEVNSKIRIYPNPAIDKTTLLLDEIALPCEISLLDVIGKTVFNNRITESESVIDLSTIAKGVYFVQINNEQLNKTVRLVVQ